MHMVSIVDAGIEIHESHRIDKVPATSVNYFIDIFIFRLLIMLYSTTRFSVCILIVVLIQRAQCSSSGTTIPAKKPRTFFDRCSADFVRFSRR